jgi:hypothetical protein
MTRSVADDTVVVPMPIHAAGSCGCRPSRRRCDHHDRLLAVECDPDAMIDLFELAVTWAELDYSEADVLPPEAWIDFADDHRWRRPDRMARVFALAADIALRGPSSAPRSGDLRAAWLISDADVLRGGL